MFDKTVQSRRPASSAVESEQNIIIPRQTSEVGSRRMPIGDPKFSAAKSSKSDELFNDCNTAYQALMSDFYFMRADGQATMTRFRPQKDRVLYQFQYINLIGPTRALTQEIEQVMSLPTGLVELTIEYRSCARDFWVTQVCRSRYILSESRFPPFETSWQPRCA